eukprot:3245256-Rhodomonas_salina.2
MRRTGDGVHRRIAKGVRKRIGQGVRRRKDQRVHRKIRHSVRWRIGTVVPRRPSRRVRQAPASSLRTAAHPGTKKIPRFSTTIPPIQYRNRAPSTGTSISVLEPRYQYLEARSQYQTRCGEIKCQKPLSWYKVYGNCA